MEDVDGGLALHPGLDGEPGEVVRCFADIVPGELHGDGAVLDLTEEHESAGLHAGAVAHALGMTIWPLGPTFADPIRSNGTQSRTTSDLQYHYPWMVPPSSLGMTCCSRAFDRRL